MSNASESEHVFETPTRFELETQLRELQDELDRQVYQQNAAAACIELLQAEVEKLESPSLGGFMASLLGTKPAKLDAYRTQSANLEAEQAASAQAIDNLEQQIANLDAQLAALPVEEDPAVPANGADPGETMARDLERAIDEGETLLNNLTGVSRACGQLRHGSAFSGAGAILAAVASTTRHRAANSLTRQIADSVRHFLAKLESVQLDPAVVSEDVEILAATAQLKRFTDASVLEDNWAELEVLAGSLVTDLRRKLKRG